VSAQRGREPHDLHAFVQVHDFRLGRRPGYVPLVFDEVAQRSGTVNVTGWVFGDAQEDVRGGLPAAEIAGGLC
jgi:hypothetical protein